MFFPFNWIIQSRRQLFEGNEIHLSKNDFLRKLNSVRIIFTFIGLYFANQHIGYGTLAVHVTQRCHREDSSRYYFNIHGCKCHYACVMRRHLDCTFPSPSSFLLTPSSSLSLLPFLHRLSFPFSCLILCSIFSLSLSLSLSLSVTLLFSFFFFFFPYLSNLPLNCYYYFLLCIKFKPNSSQQHNHSIIQ